MRAKTAARGGRKSSTPSTSASPQRFSLGELVICRYSTYPYWPATIDQTHQVRYKGAHVLKRRTRRGEKVLSYWCTFSNEDTGGWVRHDRITRYHPDIVPKIRLDESDEFFDDQAEALNVAQRAYAALPASARSHKPPARLPKDFSANVAVNSDDEDMLKSDGDEDDDDDDEEEGGDDDNGASEPKEKTLSKSTNSRTKRRGSSRPSSKRNGASTPAPMTAQAARESDDEMDLGDDSEDELENPDDNGNDKEESKPASRKPAKRARLSTPPQSNRRTSTTSTGKPQPSTARTTRTSVTPKKEPRRTSTKRKPTVAPPVSRDRKRNKTSSQNSVPPAPSKPTTSEPQADENALEIPIPNEEPSDGTPIVKKKFNSVSKPPTMEKSSDSEHDDQSSPKKHPPSKSATDDSPSSSKKQVAGKESADAIKETSKGSENKQPSPESKSQVKSPSSDLAKSSSSSAADNLDRDASKPKDEDASSDKDKSRSKSYKEDDHSSVKSSGSLSTSRKKSEESNIILGRDQINDPIKKASDAHILLPKVGVSSASKGSGLSPKSEQKGIEGKDGATDSKGADSSTVKIDVFKGDHAEEENKPDAVKIKIVEDQSESESPSISKDHKRIKSMDSGKKGEESTEPDGNTKPSKASAHGNSEPSKGRTASEEKPSSGVGTSVRRLPKGSNTSPKRISGTTSDNRKTKSHDVRKDSSPSKTGAEHELNKDSKAVPDSAPKGGSDAGFVKIDIETKPGMQEKPHEPPEVKILDSCSDTALGKNSATTGQKPVASDGSAPKEVDSSGIEKQTEQQLPANKDDSEVVAEAERSSPANKSDVATKNAKVELSGVTESVKSVNTDRERDNKEGDTTAEKSAANNKDPGATLSNAPRSTTGAKQPIMVKVAPLRPTSSTEKGNKPLKGNNSRSTVHDKSTEEVATKPEKMASAEAERLAKMSENSAIQAGIAAEGVQEDITTESLKDTESTDVKRQTTSDTTEMDIVMESPGSTVEELKDQLERARLTIGKLRSKLKALDEPRGGKNIGATSLATFVMPIAPDNLQLALPSQSLYMSDPVDADRFVDVVQHIRKTFDNFKSRVKAAEVARIELQSQAVELRKRYEEKCETVLKAEAEAVMEERELIDILKKLLIYKVSAAELKKHKAGNLVRSIGKTCKQMPAVANLCDEIYVTWRSHFLRHLVSSTEKSKEGGEHESDGLELTKKDETEKSRIEEKLEVGVSVEPITKASPVVEKKAESSRNKENEKVDHVMDEGNLGGNGDDDDGDVEGTGDDVDMEDAGEDNRDGMDMDDDESGDDDDDDDDDDDASEKKSGDANDADDDDDLE